MQRPEKKSESLEVRLSYSAKRAFMEKCRERGTSASEELRAYIERVLTEPVPQPPRKASVMPLILKPAAIAAAITPVVAIWIAMTPVPVAAQPDLRTMFDRQDADGDGRISLTEFAAARDDQLMFVDRGDSPQPPAAGAVPFAMPLGPNPTPPPHAEMRPVPREMLVAEHTRQDLDRNGNVSFDEFAMHHREMIRAGFHALDRNRDDAIDGSEFRAAMAQLPHPDRQPDFAALDRDGNGRIEWEEFGPR